MAPLTDVANAEKKMPDEYIDSEKNFITPAFLDYVRPLIGPELLNYVHLES